MEISELKTRQILKGNSSRHAQTGHGEVVTVLYSDGKHAYAMPDERVYAIHDHIETFEFLYGTSNIIKRFEDFKGFKFGDAVHVSDECKKNWKNIWQDYAAIYFRKQSENNMTPIFVGKSLDGYDKAIKGKIYIVFAPADGHTGGSPLPYVNLTEDEFLSCMYTIDTDDKKLTVHYLNTIGEKTKANVNSMDEIKDMKEFLYQITN